MRLSAKSVFPAWVFQSAQWRRASVDDLYTLTAAWLRGEIEYHPGYPGGPPDPETIEIAEDLAALNSGRLLLTTGSQPAADDCMRGFIGGYATPQNARRIAEAMQDSHRTRCITRATTRKWWERLGATPDIPAVIDDDNRIQLSVGNTWFSHSDIDTDFGDTLSARTLRDVAGLTQVTLIDMQWGDDSDMWTRLLTLLPDTKPITRD